MRRPGLDGLRGLAVLLVVGRHLGAPGLMGGWVGVDVFFVLSGYLITSLLLAEREETGTVRLRRFYLRRAARLYPALLLMVAAAAVVPAAFAGDVGFGPSAVLALTYTQDLPPLLVGRVVGGLGHTWTLALEEQFYLLWPLLLGLLRSRRAVAVAAFLLANVSLWVFLLAPSADLVHTAWYFAPHTRVWALLAGCVLAAGLPAARSRVPLRAARSAATAGLALLALVVAVAEFAGWDGVPSLAVFAVGGTVLVISGVVLADGGPVGRALAWRPLAGLGRVSYGVYLFHYVVLEQVRYVDRGRHPLAAEAVGLLVTAALVAASYRLVERPVLRRVAGWTARGDVFVRAGGRFPAGTAAGPVVRPAAAPQTASGTAPATGSAVSPSR